MNNILGAGTFPKEPEKAGLLAAQDTTETVGAHFNSRDELGGDCEELPVHHRIYLESSDI